LLQPQNLTPKISFVQSQFSFIDLSCTAFPPPAMNFDRESNETQRIKGELERLEGIETEIAALKRR
jgi:hypothetical protein